MSDAILIRPAGSSDLEVIAAIFHAAVRAVASRHYTQAQVEAWSPSEHSVDPWKKRIVGLKVLVGAVSNNPPGGFIGFADDGYIDLLFTHPDYLRRGIARSLLQRAEDDLIHNGIVSTYSNVSITARPFFERMGYRWVKDQRVWCRSVEFQNFRMEKNLSHS